MARKKGEETKAEIIAAACTVFSENGYHGTRVQEICKLAGVNIAAINYHFGGKDNLYMEVWKKFNEEAESFFTEFDKEPDPKKRLKMFIEMRVRKSLTDDKESWHPNLIHKEIGNPSPNHHDIMMNYIMPKGKRFRSIVREIVGEGLDDEQLRILAFCIHSPLVHMIDIKEKSKNPIRQGKSGPLPMQHPDLVAKTIYRLALAGLDEYKNNKEENE